MTRQEMLSMFSKHKVPPDLFYLGSVDRAEMVNGLTWDGKQWMVYYRERGTLFDTAYFSNEGDANAYYCNRILELNKHLNKE